MVLAVASPTRRPVKDPGPLPTASAVTSSSVAPAPTSTSSICSSRCEPCRCRTSRRLSDSGASRPTTTTLARVEVSSARMQVRSDSLAHVAAPPPAPTSRRATPQVPLGDLTTAADLDVTSVLVDRFDGHRQPRRIELVIESVGPFAERDTLILALIEQSAGDASRRLPRVGRGPGGTAAGGPRTPTSG